MEIMRQDMAVTHRNPNKSKQMTTAFSCSFICCIFTRLAINFTIFFWGGGGYYTQRFFWGERQMTVKEWLRHTTGTPTNATRFGLRSSVSNAIIIKKGLAMS